MIIHPLAELLPAISEQEAEALKSSLAKSGQLVPIITLDGQIIDGRSRYWALQELGITPKSEEYKGPKDTATVINAVIALNVSRRHLTISQRAAVAANALAAFELEAANRQKAGLNASLEDRGKAARFAGQTFGVNRGYVEAAKQIRAQSPELFAELLAGTITMTDAARYMKEKQDRQAGTARTPAVRLPKLSVPEEAKRLICIWGTEKQVQQVQSIAGEHRISYLRAELHDGKWITQAPPVTSNFQGQ